MDGMLDKKKLMTRERLQAGAQATEQQRKQNQMLDAALQMQERNRELQESRYSWWGMINWKDSEEMTQVKQANQALVDYMNTTMENDDAMFEQQLTKLTGLYEAVVEKCTIYLDLHKKTPKFESGKIRKRLVKQQLDDAKRDLKMLRQKAYDIHRKVSGFEFGKEVLWVNVLGAIRSVKVDVTKNKKGKTGGATSDVTILEIKKKKYFYKQDETLKSPMEEFDRKFQGKGKTKAVNRLTAQLRTILTEGSKSTIMAVLDLKAMEQLSSKKSEDWAQGAKRIKDALMVVDEETANALNWEDTTVIRMLHEVLPQYDKWKTRYEMAKSAKIDEGSQLTDRNIATSRLAKLMGFENLVVSSQKVVTEKNKTGVVTKEARGLNLQQLSDGGKNEVIYTPEAARKLSMLQLFDVLCGQVDRNASNLFYIAEKIEVKGEKPVYRVTDIQGIDNDMAFGKLLWSDVTQYSGTHKKLVAPEYQGKCQLPAIDQDMAAAIDALEIEQVKYMLQDILKDDELSALENRLNGLKEMIHKNPELVKPKEEWDTKLLNEFQFGNHKQPGNAYCQPKQQEMEHEYQKEHPDFETFCKAKDKVSKDMEKADLAGKVKLFIQYYGKLNSCKESTKYSEMFDDIIHAEVEKQMSTKMLDAMVKERMRLVTRMISEYQRYIADGIPEAQLKKQEDKDNPEAKAEYARSRLLTMDEYKELSYFNMMMPMMVMFPDIVENGKVIEPAEYLTLKLREAVKQSINGMSSDDVNKIVEGLDKTPEEYKYIHKNIIQGYQRLNEAVADSEAEELITDHFGPVAQQEVKAGDDVD